jgi:predicted nucleotidyltransferase
VLAAGREPFGADDANYRFRTLLRALDGAGLDFIVVGGVAATLHGVAEPTRDLDVCIRLGEESWRRVATVLAPLNPRFALTVDRRPIPLDELSSFKNLYALTSLGRVDFLGAVEPFGDFDVLLPRAEGCRVDDLTLKVISRDDLITVKEHVRRPKDLEVARALRALRDADRAR